MLIVKEKPGNVLECCPEGACGTPTVGRGSTVAEAVGDYVIQVGLIQIACQPPTLLNRYKNDVRGWQGRS